MSNTGSAREQWLELATSIGFTSEEDMWKKLYMEDKRTISDLSKTLGYGTATIQRRIAMHITEGRRGRGGKNTPSKVQEKVFRLDQRFVALAHPEEIAKLCDCSVHSVYRIKREMAA